MVALQLGRKSRSFSPRAWREAYCAALRATGSLGLRGRIGLESYRCSALLRVADSAYAPHLLERVKMFLLRSAGDAGLRRTAAVPASKDARAWGIYGIARELGVE